MASKVLGVRVPGDLAEEFEQKSAERGMTVTEVLRKLIDDMLYPSSSERATTMGGVSRKQGQPELGPLEDRLELIETHIDWVISDLESTDKKTTELRNQTTDELTRLNDLVSKLGPIINSINSKLTEFRDANNRLSGIVNNNSDQVKHGFAIAQADLDLLYQVLDRHKHLVGRSGGILTGSATAPKSDLINKRIAEANDRRGKLEAK